MENGSTHRGSTATENENSEITKSTMKESSSNNLCDSCGVYFTEKAIFDDHQKTCHLQINFPNNATGNNILAETSEKSTEKSNFPQNNSTTTPIKIKTENILQEFKCARCDVECPNAESLEKHQKNQWINLKYCKISSCHFKSCSVRGLERHRQKEHPDDDLNFPPKFNFKCERCDVGFLRATNWKNHMQLYKLKELKICPACPFKSCSIGSIYR